MSRAVDGFCRRGFYRKTRTLYFTPDDPCCLDVPDLVSVTSLLTDSTNTGTYDRTWATTDYALTPVNAPSEEPAQPYTRVFVSTLSGTNNYTFPVGTQNGARLIGVYGWPEVPDPVREVTLLAGLNFLSQLSAPSGVVTSEALGAFIVSPAFTKLANLMLIPFRRMGVTAAVGGGY
jgi:hypothetical protein